MKNECVVILCKSNNCMVTISHPLWMEKEEIKDGTRDGLDSVVSSVCTGHVRDCFYGVQALQPAVPLWMPPLSLLPP